MILISHRGNISGPDPVTENTEKQIELAMSLGFHVEVDVWKISGLLMLGHDAPLHQTTLKFLQNENIWAHAKNLEALDYLLRNDVHCFWHENDERTLTSRGVIWTYPNKRVTENSVIVCLDKELNLLTNNLLGVCGDYVVPWKTTYSHLL